jgi:hypothetical protein
MKFEFIKMHFKKGLRYLLIFLTSIYWVFWVILIILEGEEFDPEWVWLIFFVIVLPLAVWLVYIISIWIIKILKK